MNNIIYLHLFSYQLFFMFTETLSRCETLSSMGCVTNVLSDAFKRLYIRSRKDEYDIIGSSLPALVITWDHLLVDSLSIQNIVKYYTR